MTNADSIPLLLGGIISLALFLFIIIKKNNQKTLLFSVFCLGLSMHGIFGFFTSYTIDQDLALFLNKLSFIGLVISLPSLIHFSFEYGKHPKSKMVVKAWYLIALIFIILAFGDSIFSGLKPVKGGFSGIPGSAFIYFLAFVIASYALVMYNFISNLNLAKSKDAQNRIKYLITLFSFLAIAGTLDILRKTGILVLVNLLLIEYAIIIFVIGTFYAIEKYHLLEIRLVFHKGTMFSIIGASVLILFELLKSLVGEILDFFLIHNNNVAVSQVSLLCLTFLFEPIRGKTEKFCDRVFLKK